MKSPVEYIAHTGNCFDLIHGVNIRAYNYIALIYQGLNRKATDGTAVDQ